MHLFLRQSVIVAVSLLERRVSELLRSVAASDSESSVSGVDVFAADVHPSPFRDQETDEFAGHDIPYDTRKRHPGVSGLAEVPDYSGFTVFFRFGGTGCSGTGQIIEIHR